MPGLFSSCILGSGLVWVGEIQRAVCLVCGLDLTAAGSSVVAVTPIYLRGDDANSSSTLRR